MSTSELVIHSTSTIARADVDRLTNDKGWHPLVVPALIIWRKEECYLIC